MAALANSKMAELDEKFLCEVCAERYKRPKILPCGHTFCQECLEKWAKANRGKELTCPNCRQLWQVPVGGVEKLPTNYHLKGMIESLVESEEAKQTDNGDNKMCEFCKNKEAKLFCLECSMSFCDKSAEGHERMRSNANHKVVSLEDYRANYENKPARLKLSECDLHPGIQLRYYCQTCSVPTCLECSLIEHCLPQHEHIDLSEAAREGQDSIKKSLREVQSKVNYYNKKVANIRKVKEDLRKNKNTTSLEIGMHTGKLINKIQEIGKEMKRKVYEIYEAKAKVLDSQLDRMELVKGQMQSSIEYAQSLVELGTDAGLMSVHKQTQEMLEGLLREEIQVEPQVNQHLKYSANPAFATGQQGSVTDNKAVACQSIVVEQKKNKSLFQLVTQDMHGDKVRQGEAEVRAEVTTENGERVASDIKDNSNGTYDITFTLTKPGTHWLNVSLFGQPVKHSPIKVSFLPLLQTTREIQVSEAGLFGELTGVAVSKVGDIYVADYDKCKIQVFDSNGEYQKHFPVTRFLKKVKPWGVAFTREDHLVIADVIGKRVCVCDTDGKLLRYFGKGQIKFPEGVAVGSDGQIHVADWGGHCVKTFTPEGGLVRTMGGQQGDQPGQFNSPHSVAVNSRDQIIVSDHNNHRVQVFDSSGVFLFTFGRQGEGEGELNYPSGVAVDQYDNIIICDENNDRIVMFSPEGEYIGRVDDPSDEIKGPEAITIVPGQPLKLIVTESNLFEDINKLRFMENK